MSKLFVTLTVLCIFGAVLSDYKKVVTGRFFIKIIVCKKEARARNVDVMEFLRKKPASSTEGKCFRSCIMKKLKLMDSNGKFDKAVAMSHAKKYIGNDADRMKNVDEILSPCSDIDVSSDECEAAEQYIICFKEQAIAHGTS